MVLYFSGTGNSEYAAKVISKNIGDSVINLFSKIRKNDCSQIDSALPFVIVCPTYAWRIPLILEKWLREIKFSGNRDVYFVMTCGGNIGNAAAYCGKLCHEKNMNFMGCFPVIMPENYIAMFGTPTPEEAEKVINDAKAPIDEASKYIVEKKPFPSPKITLVDKISSGIVNDVFYPLFVHAKKFYTTDNCISCGKCVNVCPLGNIVLKDRKPVWGKECTHCMACICRCPKDAIEYGKHSKGLPRYVFPDEYNH